MKEMNMTKDEIIRMAREAGWTIRDDMPYLNYQALQDALIGRLERFFHSAYAAGAAAEREECAKAADEAHELMNSSFQGLAAAIRARGEQK